MSTMFLRHTEKSDPTNIVFSEQFALAVLSKSNTVKHLFHLLKHLLQIVFELVF